MSKKSIYNFFKRKSIERQQKKSIQFAKNFSKQMIEGREKAKQDFKLKLLQNLRDYNEAYDYIDKTGENRGGEEAIQELVEETKNETINDLEVNHE